MAIKLRAMPLPSHKTKMVATPTHSGTTARAVARFRPPVWTVAFTTHADTAQNLVFTYGVHPLEISSYPEDWHETVRETLRGLGLEARNVLLITGPSEHHPDANRRLEFLAFQRNGAKAS